MQAGRCAIEASNYALRFLPECVARGMDQVASNVIDATAAAPHLVADVRGVHIEVAEEACDRSEFSNAAFVEQFAKP